MPLTKVTGGEIDGASSINVTGIVTATSFSGNVSGNINSSGVSTFSTLRVGTGVTITSGVVTATSFVGNLTGNVTGNLTGNATGLSGTPSISVDSITAATATFTGNVSVAGTVTYEDVTNIDSIGIVTARGGLRVGTGGTVITTTTDGLVGIGTANPGYQVIIFGSTPQLAVQHSGTNRSRALIEATDSAVYYGQTYGLNNIPVIFSQAGTTSGVERFRIDTIGNIGIGLTNPLNKLHVSGSARIDGNTNPYLVLNDGTNTGYLQIASGLLDLYHNGNITFSPGSSQKVIINSSGNLGVGTTNPTSKLHTVSGSNVLKFPQTDGGDVGLQLESGASGHVPSLHLKNSAGYWRIANHTSDASLRFFNGTDRFVVQADGSVGIGTNSPSSGMKLDVRGRGYFESNTSISLSAVGIGETYNPNGAISSKDQYQNAGIIVGFAAAPNSVNSACLIDFNAYNSSNGATDVYIGGVAGPSGNGPANFVVGRRTAVQSWAESLRVDTSGRLGIGITNPTDKLEVAGDFKAILDTTGATSTAKNVARIVQLGYSGGTGARNWALRGVYQYASGVNSNADGGDLDLIKSLNANTILATKTDGTMLGSVGVGTINPTHRLDILTTSIVSGLRVSSSNDWGDINTPMVDLDGNRFGNGDGNILRLRTGAARGDVEILDVQNGSGTQFVIKGSGNVGINTASPTEKLDVRGSISAAGRSLNVPHIMVKNSSGDITYFEYYFTIVKNTGSGTATNKNILSVASLSSFHQAAFTVEYGTRLQGVSDATTSVCLKQFGVNKFNSGNVAITDTNDIASDTNSNTHANVTCITNGASGYIIRGEFSSTLADSSFISGVLRGWGVNDSFNANGGTTATLTFTNGPT